MDIVAWIENHVIKYFADRFSYPPTSFNSDTDVRSGFHFGNEAWEELADRFNRLDWMIEIHVLLGQQEMDKLNTIGDLTTAIYNKYSAERAFAAQVVPPKAGNRTL